MRIFFIINETSFCHPRFLANFLRETRDNVVGAAVIPAALQKNGIEHYLARTWAFLKPRELIKLAWQKYSACVRNILVDHDWLAVSDHGPFFSVESVLRYFHIDYFKVDGDINNKEYLSRIKTKDIDVLISSNSLLLRADLLAIPRICALNRHSALLPSYRGIFPVFHACRRGEAHTGVSVHIMGANVDDGIVLAHRKIPIGVSASVTELYETCFELSSEAVMDALDKIRNNDFSPNAGANESSYYSYPTAEHWREFRARGGRIV